MEFRRKETEKTEDFVIHPYDPWIRENFVLSQKTGLANLYPWLRNERIYCTACKKYYPAGTIKCDCGGRIEQRTVADEIVEKEILPPWKNKEMGLDPNENYYTFFDIDVFRAGSRLPVGEIEDITFSVYTYTISHNILLVKLLELKCREREFERYIDEILGVRMGEENIEALVKHDFPEFNKDDKKFVERFNDPSFDYLSTLILSEDPEFDKSRLDGAQPQGIVNIDRYSNDALELSVECDRPVILYAAESYHPSWKAEVDGAPARIYRANLAMRAVFLDQGKHKVTMKYVSRPFIWGRRLSILALVVLAVSVGLTLYRKGW
jgi:hypothetical protein